MVFAWVSAWFPLSFAGFVQFSIRGRFSEVSAGFLGCNFVWKVCRTSSQQKLDRCAALRQILYLCRDHFWSQKKMEFRYRFGGDLHGTMEVIYRNLHWNGFSGFFWERRKLHLVAASKLFVVRYSVAS